MSICVPNVDPCVIIHRAVQTLSSVEELREHMVVSVYICPLYA